jgi:hypothetical protein
VFAYTVDRAEQNRTEQQIDENGSIEASAKELLKRCSGDVG